MNRFAAWAICAFMLVLPNALLAQQEKGDKEIGIDGAATISNSKPITGNIFAEFSLGKYIKHNQYVGIYAAPLFSLGGGDNSGALGVGGEYRYLFGRKNSRLWPFLGALGGETVSRSNGAWTHGGSLAPEFGIKVYASQKTAFEASYHLLIQFSGGASHTSFSDRTQNLVVFGFKHIF